MPEDRSAFRTAFVVVIIVAVVAAIAWILLREGAKPESVAALEPTAAPSPVPTATPIPRLAGVTLATSDAVVREMVAQLSSRPEVAKWLANEDLVRRFVSTVANVSDGRIPRSQLEFLAPKKGFTVIQRGAETVPDPASYRRYDRIAGVVGSVDAAGAVALLQELDPLIRESWGEIAPPDRDFRATLREAIDSLLAVPVLEQPPALEQKVMWTYTDPHLEGLTPAQRQLLRMGPDNVRTIQAKLREIRALL
jgi:hypothetical protein